MSRKLWIAPAAWIVLVFLALPKGAIGQATKVIEGTARNLIFDADVNTLSNVDNADIKAGAAIDRAKLAAGGVDHVVINNGSGVLSSEAALDESRGGTGVSSTAVFPTTASDTGSDFVMKAGTETITGVKTIDSNSQFGTDTTTVNRAIRFKTDDTATEHPFIEFQRGGTSRGIIGTCGATNDLSAGCVLNDTVLRANGNLVMSANNGVTQHVKIDSNGDIETGTTDGTARIDATAGSAATVTYGFLGDIDTGMYRSAANTLSFSTDSTERVRFGSTGGLNLFPLTTNGPVFTSGGNGTLNSEALLALSRGGTNKSLTAAAGGAVYTDADSIEVTAAGVSGQRLTSAGASSPTWAWESVRQISTGDYSSNVYTISSTDGFHAFDATTSTTSRTINLPASASSAGRVIIIRKADSGSGTLTIARDGSDTIEGDTTDILYGQYGQITLLCVGSTWYRLEVRDYKTITPSPTVSGGGGSSNNNTAHWFRNGRVRQFDWYSDYSGMSGTVVLDFAVSTLPDSGPVFGTASQGNAGTIRRTNSNGVAGTVGIFSGNVRAVISATEAGATGNFGASMSYIK
jgi:hypothetical protein